MTFTPDDKVTTVLTWWQRILKFFGFGPKPYGPKNGPGAYDVESLKNYPRVFEADEPVIVTEKIHGSNARYMFDGKTFWVGSHNIWWEVAKQYPWIEAFCRQFPTYTLRGEVTPTQKGYAYGFETEKQFFAFDVQREDGTYINKADVLKWMAIQRFVPIVYEGPYDADMMKELAEGKSLVEGAKNIRVEVYLTSSKRWVKSGNEGLWEKKFKTIFDAEYAITNHGTSDVEYRVVLIDLEPEKLCDKLARIAALNAQIKAILEEE